MDMPLILPTIYFVRICPLHTGKEHRGLIDYGDYPASWKDKISGIEIRRFAGAFFDPIQFGYFCAFKLLVINCRRPIFILFGVFFLYALYLSGSKGANQLF